MLLRPGTLGTAMAMMGGAVLTAAENAKLRTAAEERFTGQLERSLCRGMQGILHSRKRVRPGPVFTSDTSIFFLHSPPGSGGDSSPIRRTHMPAIDDGSPSHADGDAVSSSGQTAGMPFVHFTASPTQLRGGKSVGEELERQLGEVLSPIARLEWTLSLWLLRELVGDSTTVLSRLRASTCPDPVFWFDLGEGTVEDLDELWGGVRSSLIPWGGVVVLHSIGFQDLTLDDGDPTPSHVFLSLSMSEIESTAELLRNDVARRIGQQEVQKQEEEQEGQEQEEEQEGQEQQEEQEGQEQGVEMPLEGLAIVERWLQLTGGRLGTARRDRCHIRDRLNTARFAELIGCVRAGGTYVEVLWACLRRSRRGLALRRGWPCSWRRPRR